MKTVMVLIVLTISLWSEFTRTGYIVTDTTTGLQWEDDINITKRLLDGTMIEVSWSNALNYCEQLELGGYNDWRLPNINELSLLLGHRDKFTFGTAYNSTKYSSYHSRFFWTSTTLNKSRDKAYVVDTFYTLDISSDDKNSFVASQRCVRGGN